jgi:hypothetical protein
MEETDVVQTIPFSVESNPPIININVCAAKAMDVEQRQDVAIQAMAGTVTITQLADQLHVSRKFIHAQVDRAQEALEQAFAPAAADDKVLFNLPVTKSWLRQVVLSLLLNCHSCYRGVIAHFADCLDYSISLGTIHNIARDAVGKARTCNERVPLDRIYIGLLDEIFQTQLPVLVGVDAGSTYCFLLSQEDNRDAVTWGVRLLELKDRSFNPEAFVADFGSGLRAGHALAFPEKPCRGDVFHAQQTVVPVVTALENRAYELINQRDQCERKAANYQRRHGRADKTRAQQLRHLRPAEAQAIALADDVALLARWLGEDVFALAGPSYADRQLLYDFIVAELRGRAHLCPHRLAPLCQFLDNHRDELLAFVEQLDRDLAVLASDFQVTAETVRDLLHLQTLLATDPRRRQREADLRQLLGERFDAVQQAVRKLAKRTVRASSAVENLNSRLRKYFFLRRQLGCDYLVLLQFFLNHRPFPRSKHKERVGKSPSELLTGQPHPHWLEMLGYTRFSRN